MAQPLEVRYLPIADLIPYARNSRTHSDEQVGQIAASIKEFGFTNPVLIDEEGGIIAGHGRVMAAGRLKLAEVPTITLTGLTSAQKRAYIIADNRLPLNAGWDFEMLAVELDDLRDQDFDLGLLGFSSQELNDLIGTPNPPPPPGEGGDDDPPEVETVEVSQVGDVWQLGPHRVMCGDSTSTDDVAELMGEQKADLIHADPPYGMDFDDEGVANDDLKGSELAAFQMAWYKAARPIMQDAASVYVWGWEDSLFEFYLMLRKDKQDRITKRNYIVWDKEHGQGINQADLRRFAPVTEHCLFFMLGEQTFSTNADSYWEGWEPIRSKLAAAVEAQGWKVKDLNRITGTQMGGHWITTSQWSFPTSAHYQKLIDAATAPEAFPPYGNLRLEYEQAKATADKERAAFYASRAYFDNTHDAMTDVWRFPRVTGDERHGHATPKPVPMMKRVMKSSLPEGGICFEPFGGSGSTLMGAEKTGRVCYSMELQAKYVDVIVRRWQKFTGKKATLDGDGRSFDDIAAERTDADNTTTD